MGVVQAQVVVNLNAQNVQFLREQLRAAQDRLNVGEGTCTDVAQAEAALQSGISSYAAAGATLNAALATYVRAGGLDVSISVETGPRIGVQKGPPCR
jgi:outer membrane protein